MRSQVCRVCGKVFPALAMLAAFAVQSWADYTLPAGERQALIALYTSTNGASWRNKTARLGVPGTEHTWYGVSLTAEDSKRCVSSAADWITTGRLKKQ